MKKIFVASLLVAVMTGASLIVVGSALTAGASPNSSGCKIVKYNETKLVWNAKHTKKITVVVTHLVKETIKVKGKLKVSYVVEPVVKTVRVCTAAKSATAPTTTMPVATTIPAPTTTVPVAAAPAPTTTIPAPTTTTTVAPAPVPLAPVTTTTTTTTTTTLPPPAVPGVTINTIFINPNGVVQVTGTFTNVTSLNICTDPIDPADGLGVDAQVPPNSPLVDVVCTPTAADPLLGTYCSATIVNGSAECTLPGYTGDLGEPLNLCACSPGHSPPFSITIASTAGAASYFLEQNVESPLTTMSRYWEYPVPTPPNAGTPGTQGAASDGPGGPVTVISTGADTSDIEITGEYEDYPDATSSPGVIYITPNPASGQSDLADVAAPIGGQGDSNSITIAIPINVSLASLQQSGFQVGWDGGVNHDTEYGFPSLNYPAWTSNEIVTYDAAKGTWVPTPGSLSFP